jgi:hypothetical protein
MEIGVELCVELLKELKPTDENCELVAQVFTLLQTSMKRQPKKLAEIVKKHSNNNMVCCGCGSYICFEFSSLNDCCDDGDECDEPRYCDTCFASGKKHVCGFD